ncbi:MAG TPA: ribosome maturation factor RimP, partial [Actinopolymorphaceae bacterium]
MDSSVLRDRVVDLLAPVLAADGLDLEEAQLAQAGRRRMLRVVVDADGGVDLDQLADASRSVARALDDSDLMGAGSYTLEVTSRGVDRPLVADRHWRRNTGRLVKVTFTDGRKITGRILGSDVSGADLDVDGRAIRVAY